MKKRIVALVMAGVMAASLTACGGCGYGGRQQQQQRSGRQRQGSGNRGKQGRRCADRQEV